VHWVECVQERFDTKTNRADRCRFVHLTNIQIASAAACEVSDGGRLRWKIENEGFNTQKNGGYNPEHKYSRVSFPAFKNYYQCLQIAHPINQLIEKSMQLAGLLKADGKLTLAKTCAICFLMRIAVYLAIVCGINPNVLQPNMSLQPYKKDRILKESFLFKHGTKPSEEELVVWNALREGNQRALDYIFEKYVRLLYAYGGKITKDQGAVEDCIQDLFVELWRKHEVLGNTDNIKFYLLKSLRRRIARRISNDHRKIGVNSLQENYSIEVEFPIEFDLIQQQISIEQQEQLTHAISKLSERQREAVYLKFYEKMDYEQLAEVLGITLTSAYKLIGKAVDTLRKSVRIIS
jgi:RNA polymerase sigma factor (sigma-70 family)